MKSCYQLIIHSTVETTTKVDTFSQYSVLLFLVTLFTESKSEWPERGKKEEEGGQISSLYLQPYIIGVRTILVLKLTKFSSSRIICLMVNYDKNYDFLYGLRIF